MKSNFPILVASASYVDKTDSNILIFPLIGHTIRLLGKFTKTDGRSIDPDIVSLIISSASFTEDIEIKPFDLIKLDIGLYGYDYTIPDIKNTIHFRFLGEYNGESFVGGSIITPTWYSK